MAKLCKSCVGIFIEMIGACHTYIYAINTLVNTTDNCVTPDNLRLATLLVSVLKSTGKDILIRESVFTNFYSHGVLCIVRSLS